MPSSTAGKDACRYIFRPALAAAAVLSLALQLQAEVRLPAVFGNDMVLQQGVAVPVWGWADDGEVVTVEFHGQKVSATAQNGKWSLKLAALPASSTPETFTVSTKTKTLQLTNVLVGEVWLCSGQSNMVRSLDSAFESANDVAAATNALIRLLVVPNAPTKTPQADIKAGWVVCSPETARGFSAVAYYFGHSLQAARGGPIGLIQSAVGGTPAEAWTKEEALASNPRLKAEILDPYPEQLKKFQAALAVRKKQDEAAKAKGAKANPARMKMLRQPSELYNGMIAPLVPYAIKGAIWYQGESNQEHAEQYHTLFPAMIRNWRADWAAGDFPFLCVQLAPFRHPKEQPAESSWAEIREAQLLATKTLPQVGMAVITDVGEMNDIHPTKKKPVGVRLALAARALAYGEKIEFSGPIYRNQKTDGGKIIISFDHVGQGLEARDGELKGFAICGADKKFVWAKAAIVGDTVVVSSPEVAAPIAVRFGWDDYPVVNLRNKNGLPASPFRTDDFPMLTQAKQ